MLLSARGSPPLQLQHTVLQLLHDSRAIAVQVTSWAYSLQGVTQQSKTGAAVAARYSCYS